MKLMVGLVVFVPLSALALWLGGCASSSETAERDKLTANVGIYDPPPSGIYKARVGVPPFTVKEKAVGSEVGDLAADQLDTLLVNTDRFNVIERTQLDQLLKEQGLEGIVRGDELAKQAKVRGVDYLLLGKVTNFRVKAEKTATGFGLGDIAGPLGMHVGGFDYKNKKSRVKSEIGVDIRLVDPSTGEVPVAQFGEYNRIDEIGAIGIEVLGTNAEAEADLKIDEDSKGRLLRLALDDAVKKMLRKTDSLLLKKAAEKKAEEPKPASTTIESAPSTSTAPPSTNQPAVAKKFCASCGKELAAGVKFCPGCGAKVE